MSKWKSKGVYELAHMRWSDFPKNQWIGIVIPNPKDFKSMAIPRTGVFVVYKAYFPFMKEKRMFNLVLPLNKWKEALKAVPQKLREDLDKPVQFELKKAYKGNVYIQNWRQLE